MAPSFSEPHHLPKLRSGRDPADPYQLPRQRRGLTPQMHGRYPDFDVLGEAAHWDEETRRVVMGRVEQVPERRFFSEPEFATLGTFCDDVMAQDSDPRIPVLSYVDEKLDQGKLDGYQYATMPDDRDTWRLVARGLDEAVQLAGHDSYAVAPEELREQTIDAFAEGKLAGGAWEELDTKRAFSVLMRAILSAFYAHPWAWNEIGFGGPAYPRGYARMGVGHSEAWEGQEALDVDPVPDVKERGLE
ncbi:MAG TPA: gluconate 2-dehydrogenase subunit 3 family protein [Gaiellales bacterium]|nr:gluconate 2-dehydrogenase subunit 3 family protein [Gaiellales bacterium]